MISDLNILIADMTEVRKILDKHNTSTENQPLDNYVTILNKIIKELLEQKALNSENTLFLSKIKSLLGKYVTEEEPSNRDYINALEKIKEEHIAYSELISKLKRLIKTID